MTTGGTGPTTDAMPPGPGVDAQNRPVVDPTANVMAVISAESNRQDGLRKKDRQFFEMSVKINNHHLATIIKMQAQHDRQLRKAEAKRIDAIRAVDVQAVQAAAQEQRDAADRLATQVSVSADALRLQVAATAAATEQKLVATVTPLQNAIEDLRKAQYQTQGEKAQVVETRLATDDLKPILDAIRELQRVEAQRIGGGAAITTSRDNTRYLITLFGAAVLGLQLYNATRGG